jgi:methylenetetrahydrofolate dehydrogenase (NADP+)/methenyltetrahydrofolate cyclohydrolase/formyltetrahydrofolate synthetase
MIINILMIVIADPTKKVGQKLVGDVDFDQCKKVASFITPVPGENFLKS